MTSEPVVDEDTSPKDQQPPLRETLPKRLWRYASSFGDTMFRDKNSLQGRDWVRGVVVMKQELGERQSTWFEAEMSEGRAQWKAAESKLITLVTLAIPFGLIMLVLDSAVMWRPLGLFGGPLPEPWNALMSVGVVALLVLIGALVGLVWWTKRKTAVYLYAYELVFMAAQVDQMAEHLEKNEHPSGDYIEQQKRFAASAATRMWRYANLRKRSLPFDSAKKKKNNQQLSKSRDTDFAGLMKVVLEVGSADPKRLRSIAKELARYAHKAAEKRIGIVRLDSNLPGERPNSILARRSGIQLIVSALAVLVGAGRLLVAIWS